MKRIHKLWALIAGAICSLILGMIFIAPTSTIVPASAATVIGDRLIGDTGLFIEEGAAVRVKSTSTETNGLRYTIGMNREQYNGYMENPGLSDIIFGILIAPATDKYNLTPQTVFGIGGEQKYDWAEKENGDWVYKGDGTKTQIINLQTKKLFEVAGRPTDSYYFQGSVVNIKPQNLTNEFQGIGYVLYTAGGVRNCEMLTNETHIRSITYVAQRAIEDGNANASWLKENYVDKATVKNWTYTTENYLEQANGAFVKDENVETTTGTLGTTVSTASAPNYSGLRYDPTYDLGVSTGTVLANNKLVLKRYYRLAYDMPAATTSTVQQKTEKTVGANTDYQARLLNNVGENYAAVTFKKSENSTEFSALVLNIMGSVSNVWNGEFTLSISGNGIFLTSGVVSEDTGRIARFSGVEPNTSEDYTIVYKLTYQGNEYYSNGIKLELWMANHASGADLSQVTFTKATVAEIVDRNNAYKHYITKDLVLDCAMFTESQFVSTNCEWMVPGGWNPNTSWTMKKAQILSVQPKDQGTPAASVSFGGSRPLVPSENGTAVTLVKNYRTEYISFTLKPSNIPTSSEEYYGICLNILGDTYNNYWKGGLILRLDNNGLLLWKGGIADQGTPIAMFVSAAHNYDWASGFSICYKLDFPNQDKVVMELYLKMGNGEYEVLEPLQLAGDISYEDGKYVMRTSMFDFSPFPDCTLFAHSAYNTGCDRWTVSGVGISDEPPVSEGYENPVTGDAVLLNVEDVEEIDHTVDTIKTMATNVNENYMSVTVKASDLVNSSYYGFGINILGTTTTGWDGGVVLAFTKDGIYLRHGGMEDTDTVLARLGAGNIQRLDTSITIAYKLSFGTGAFSDKVAMQFWAASAGASFAPLGCEMVDSVCTYNTSTQQYILPYTLFTEEEYKADCTVIFLAAHNNQTVPCDWEIQDVEILSQSPDAGLSYWKNPVYAGVSVDANGIMYLGEEKLYTAGVNCYSLFNQCWNANPAKISIADAKDSLDELKSHNIKVVRFNCGGYLATSNDASAQTIAMYEANKDILIALLKDIVAYAEDLEIGLVPSFFWLYSAVPSYCNEAPSAWGDANSKTRAYMVEYTTTIVNELKGFHSIFGWEFGNEFNLHCDLPNATEEFTSEDANLAIAAFDATVRGLDVVSNRFIGSGHSAPRPAQYNLSIKNGWTNDTDSQYSMITKTLNPCNAISEHVYHDTTTKTFAEYFTRAVSMAANLKKAYYVGEWGHGDEASNDYANEEYYSNLANAIVNAKVQLSLLWNYDCLGVTEKSFYPSNWGEPRSDMLWEILENMNTKLANGA